MKLKALLREKTPKLYTRVQELKQDIGYYQRKITPAKRIPHELKKAFFKKNKYELNIENPVTYTEKIQWLKLYDPNPLRSMLTDKVAVEKWVEEKVGKKYLIPTIGVYERFDDIDFNKLPKRFVMKTNHSSGWNIIVHDKDSLDIKEARRKFNRWLKMDYAYYCQYEIHYTPIKPLIQIQEYIEDPEGDLRDYKFLCFGGVPRFVWVDYDRFSNHKRNVFNMEWELQPWNQYSYGNHPNIDKPLNYEEMVSVATELCKGFPHVRVDLYNVNGKIFFGEMTFTNGGGLEPIYPREYDKMLGDLIILPQNNS